MLEKTVKFLKGVTRNNNREWFQAHREEYLEAKTEFESFVGRLIPLMQEMDPEIGPLEISDCTYRIYRDTRFSPDKTPYKNHMGAYINRKGKKSPFAGYYFHICPVEGSLWGGGLYCPDPKILKAVRQDIYDNIEEFHTIIDAPSFAERYRFFEENKLKKAPQGFPSDWPDIELLKNRNFDVFQPIPDDVLKSDQLVQKTVEAFEAMKPLNHFFNYTIEQEIERGGSFARSITHSL